MKKTALCLALLLTACVRENNNTPTPAASTPTPVKTKVASAADLTDIKPIITSEGKTQINWQAIDTKEPRADLATYAYPIALDSTAVKNYAKAYNISDKAAQHSVVVGMAAPEALGKLLDQLIGKYVSHHLNDGADMSLVVRVTPDVVGERHEYVFADTFGRGLVLPIVIEPVADVPTKETATKTKDKETKDTAK